MGTDQVAACQASYHRGVGNTEKVGNKGGEDGTSLRDAWEDPRVPIREGEEANLLDGDGRRMWGGRLVGGNEGPSSFPEELGHGEDTPCSHNLYDRYELRVWLIRERSRIRVTWMHGVLPVIT